MATEKKLPPWVGAPKLEFQLFENPIKMARSYHSLGVNLRRLLMEKSDEEEGGTQYVQDVKISESHGFVHSIPELPTKPSYFIVEMLPPPDMEEHMPFDGEVELLFAANSMYHLGFSANGAWHVFKDAILPGVSKESEAEYNIQRLDFRGSYQDIGMDFKELVIGFRGQLETYQVLVHFGWATRKKLIEVACRNVVTFSESIRFPILFKLNLTKFQLGNLHAVLDVPVKKDEVYRNVSVHFTDWSNYSEKCREGKEKFAAEWKRIDPEFRKYLIPGIPTFDALLNFVGLLSNKNHKKTHKEDEPAKDMKHRSANREDHKKGGGDDDPPSDKDGNDQERKNKDTSSAWFFESLVMPYHGNARALDRAEMVFLVAICTPVDYNMQPLDAIYSNFIDTLPVVKYCSENIKHLIYLSACNFSTCEVFSKITVSFLAKDHPHHKETRSDMLKVSPFGPIVKQRRSYSCVTQLIFCDWTESLENDLEFTIVRPFNSIGQMVDSISDADGPSEGVPWVLACFNNNLLRRETWKLVLKEATKAVHVDGGESHQKFVCMKEATKAVLLLIVYGSVPGELLQVKPLVEASAEYFFGEGYDGRNKKIPDVALINDKQQQGEPPLEEQFLGEGYGKSDKRSPGVTLISNKQLGWSPNAAVCREAVERQLSQAPASSWTTCRGVEAAMTFLI